MDRWRPDRRQEFQTDGRNDGWADGDDPVEAFCGEAKRVVRSPTIRSRKSRADACKTAARAEMLQTHKGGDSPAVCVWALHQKTRHAPANASSVVHARASAFGKMLARLVWLKQLLAVSQSRMRTQPQQKLARAVQGALASVGASHGRLQSVREDGGWESPRAKHTTQKCEASSS